MGDAERIDSSMNSSRNHLSSSLQVKPNTDCLIWKRQQTHIKVHHCYGAISYCNTSSGFCTDRMIEQVLIDMTLVSVLQMWERALCFREGRHIGDRMQRGSLGLVRFQTSEGFQNGDHNRNMCVWNAHKLWNCGTMLGSSCTKRFSSTSSPRMDVIKTHHVAKCIEEKQLSVRGISSRTNFKEVAPTPR